VVFAGLDVITGYNLRENIGSNAERLRKVYLVRCKAGYGMQWFDKLTILGSTSLTTLSLSKGSLSKESYAE
jgi:hypothetical protein